VFWNLNGQYGNTPTKSNNPNVALISGFSPAIMKSVLSCKDMSPMAVMMETIGSERYQQIEVK